MQDRERDFISSIDGRHRKVSALVSIPFSKAYDHDDGVQCVFRVRVGEMSENSVPDSRVEMEDLRKIVEEKDKLVIRQFIRIEELENEVATLQQERDALLCDINKLKFELEMSELKRIKDNPNSKERPPPSLRSLPISQSNHGTEGEATLSFLAYGPGQKTVDRPTCGPGPPLKQLRSYSVDNTSQSGQLLGNGHYPNSAVPAVQNPAFGRSRQRSVSGHIGPKKTPVRRLDEETLKRTRLHTNQYELSQDLLDKQVEMLERKYGGVRARHAALTIQRAFRKYCMVKRFKDIANASKGEKRLSRRVYALELENKEWLLYKNGSTAMTPAPNHHHPHYHHHHSSRYGNYATNNLQPHQRANPIFETETERPNDVVDNEVVKNPYPLYYDDGLNESNHSRRSSSSRDRHRSSSSSYVTPTDDASSGIIANGSVSCHCVIEDRAVTDDSISGSLDAGNDSVYYTPPTRLPPNNWPASSSGCYINSSQQGSEQAMIMTQEERYHTPRESLSSEDSAISSSGAGEGELSEIRQNSLPRDLRRSSNIPRNNVHRQGTPEQLRMTQSRPGDSSSLGRRASASSATDIRKVPPQIPKRTCSIVMDSRSSSSSRASPAESLKDSGSGAYDASSVSSSGSTGSNTSGSGGGVPGVESSVRQKTYMVEASPVWKRKSLVLAEQCSNSGLAEDKRLSNISENSEDSLEGTTVGVGYCGSPPNSEMMNYPGHSYGIPGLQTPHDGIPVTPLCGVKVSEVQRKRQYRVGLNLFNKKPERGIRYLILRGFLEGSPQAVARFLISRKGLSKQMIGEYLGNLMSPFNMAVLEYFVQELDLAGMQVDVALRKFQTYFRLPGEAQKIERLVEVFSHRFVSCNRDIVNKFTNPDTVFVLAFAIIMLNTDLHTPNMKAEKRMKVEDFIKNLRGVDDGHDLDKEMLTGIYERIKANEFKPGSDHVTQVLKVHQTIVGKKPNLALPHRRLVCYCRLYEVFDVSKKERPGVHQREVFLFNDMLMVTKIFSKKKNSVTYTFRQSFPLCGMSVTLFEAPYYPHGIRLSQRVDDKVLVTFNARNEHDRSKFVEDLKESILEMDEMENLRIEAELEKQQQLVRNLTNNAATSANLNGVTRVGENRDSGVADMEIIPPAGALKEEKLAGSSARLGGSTGNLSIPPASGSNSLKRSALSNSLLDLHEQQMSKPVRRGSAGSLDSGMSVSFQSSAASTVSRDSSPQTVPSTSKPGAGATTVTTTGGGGKGSTLVAGMASAGAAAVGATGVEGKSQPGQPGFLGNLFGKKTRSASKITQQPRKLPGDSSEA